jgi:manganese/zinc/iron transport system permease protein
MGLVAMTTVGAFESVGAILVVAMLVVPGATAYLLTERLGRMIALAMIFGAASAVVGYALARTVDGSIAGAMATASGGFFALAFLFSPRQGLVARFVARARIRRRVAEEDLLLWAGRRREAVPRPVFAVTEVPVLAGAGSAGTVLGRLSRLGLVEAAGDAWALTERGLDQARELIRRHRLYESYLGELGYDPDHVHEPADRVEHWIAGEVTAEVEEAARYPERDPHDRPIPPPPGAGEPEG